MAQNTHSATAPASGTAAHAAQTRNGFICLFTTYAIWGMLPLYFYLMASSSALEIVLSRVIFSLAFCAVLLPIFRLTKPFNRAVRTPRTMGILTVASLLIGANWMIYVYSTTHGHTIDMSLGYFINPLVSVVLGVVFLHERLRKIQWVAIGISTVAVLIMSVVYGQIPWLGLGVAFTFGTYGLLKARVGSSVHPVVSLSLETFILLPVALVVLWWMNTQGQLTLFSQGPGISGYSLPLALSR
ncbi:putative chloramphenical resistance permease RarD [Rothia dentocariosa]|uniref:Putative chloramphenical resistance permease RarD n=1 Tax=Rothia dentocariosa TaxID=2047 RepID=A0A448UW58_9MICC|nr:putative chloramphenical resistance permease RarD [Rothia dentocariosa]